MVGGVKFRTEFDPSSKRGMAILSGRFGFGQHLPFATRLINPLNDQSLSTGSVEFSWEGNDLDGGALRYTLFLGTSIENLTSVAEKISTNTHVETLEEGVYFWKVTTYDSDGNSGSSVTYRFQVRD